MRKFNNNKSNNKRRNNSRGQRQNQPQPSRREGISKVERSVFDKDIVSNNHPSMKWTETQAVGSITSSGGGSVLVFPSNGTGFQARVGNVINLKRIDLSASMSLTTSGVNNFRMMLVQQIGPLVSTSWADVLMPTSTGIVPESQMIPGVTSYLNILYDEVFDLNTQATNGIVSIFRKIRPRQKRIVFEGNSNTVFSGNLVLLYLAGPGTVHVDLNSQAFLWFAD